MYIILVKLYPAVCMNKIQVFYSQFQMLVSAAFASKKIEVI